MRQQSEFNPTLHSVAGEGTISKNTQLTFKRGDLIILDAGINGENVTIVSLEYFLSNLQLISFYLLIKYI